MPKVIDNAKSKILIAAKEELDTHPRDFSMRKIAQRANMAVGTLYHYFPDKINLIASILLDDWNVEYEKVELSITECSELNELLMKIINLIAEFRKKYQIIFATYRNEGINYDFTKLHSMFMSRIKYLLEIGKDKLMIPIKEEEDEMIVEMILVQSRNNTISVETLVKMIAKII